MIGDAVPALSLKLVWSAPCHCFSVGPNDFMSLCRNGSSLYIRIRELVFSTLAGVVGKIHSSQINILVAGIVYLHPVAVIAETSA